jgi:formate dehydrogenase iron-sulfur subunit
MDEVKKALFVDVTKCIGCRGCQAACKQWNQLDAQIKPFNGSYQTQSLDSATYTVVDFIERDTAKGVVWQFCKKQCMHCTDATCVKVCPAAAIKHTEYGTVLRDMDKCIGCSYCVKNCPFGVPQPYKTGDGQLKATQCPFCYDRIVEGMEAACAKTCPTGAVIYGNKDELMATAEKRLGEVKGSFPNAMVYDPAGVGRTGVVYLFPDNPAHYGLPTNPKVPASVTVWKDLIQPLGTVVIGAALAGTAVSFVLHSFDKRTKEVAERGESHGAK